MASRYLFKVEYGENRFCSFFVNLTDFSDYSFVKLTNDIKQNVRALQVTTPNTIRIRFRYEDGDYINLPYGNRDMFIVQDWKAGKQPRLHKNLSKSIRTRLSNGNGNTCCEKR